MARKKKDGASVHFYLDSCLHKRLEEYCEETGLSKTTAVERLLQKELDAHYNAFGDDTKKQIIAEVKK